MSFFFSRFEIYRLQKCLNDILIYHCFYTDIYVPLEIIKVVKDSQVSIKYKDPT